MADYNGGQPRAQFRSFWSHAKICRNWHGRKLRLGFGRKRPILLKNSKPHPPQFLGGFDCNHRFPP